MPPDHTRIDELRRRIQKDPASIAFAQLAEEHRRAGEYEEAVQVARAGLEQHPAYLSARVTLGRALLELERYDEAQAEFEQVLLAAPDNLVALRGLAELHQKRGRESFVEDTPAEEAAVIDEAAAVDESWTNDSRPHLGDPALPELERWLDAIQADRARRASRDDPAAAGGED